MAWLLLVIAGLLEVAWAIGLKYTEGFTRPLPTTLTLGAMAASVGLLGLAMKSLPVGTAYAVWVGIGAALTAGWAMATGQEPLSVVRVLLLAGIVGCVIGLKLTH